MGHGTTRQAQPETKATPAPGQCTAPRLIFWVVASLSWVVWALAVTAGAGDEWFQDFDDFKATSEDLSDFCEDADTDEYFEDFCEKCKYCCTRRRGFLLVMVGGRDTTTAGLLKFSLSSLCVFFLLIGGRGGLQVLRLCCCCCRVIFCFFASFEGCALRGSVRHFFVGTCLLRLHRGHRSLTVSIRWVLDFRNLDKRSPGVTSFALYMAVCAPPPPLFVAAHHASCISYL